MGRAEGGACLQRRAFIPRKENAIGCESLSLALSLSLPLSHSGVGTVLAYPPPGLVRSRKSCLPKNPDLQAQPREPNPPTPKTKPQTLPQPWNTRILEPDTRFWRAILTAGTALSSTHGCSAPRRARLLGHVPSSRNSDSKASSPKHETKS